MQKNGIKVYKQINSMRNSLRMFNNRKLNLNVFSKLHSSKISSLQKNKTSSNFILYKISSLYNNNDSKENQKKIEEKQFNNIKEIFNNDINSFQSLSSRRNNFVNTIQLDENYFRLISTKNIKNKRTSSVLYDLKNSSQFLHSLYMPNKMKRIDWIKYKFLLGKKNYYKRITNSKDNGILESNKSNLTPFQLNINFNIFNEENNKTKYLMLQSEEIKSNLNSKENISFPSIQNHSIQNQNKRLRFTSIKIKKDFYQNKNHKESNDLNIKLIKSKKNNIIKKLNISGENNKDKEENNILNSPCKIIEDNYNEYLNDISSSNTNVSKENKKDSNLIKYKKLLDDKVTRRIKELRKKILIYDKNDIYKNIKGYKFNEKIKRINITNRIIKNKQFDSNKNKASEVNQNISINNPILRKRIFYK